jgi:outer membrane protein assembly factor BamB
MMNIFSSRVAIRASILLCVAFPNIGTAQSRTIEQGEWQEQFRIDEEHGHLLLKPQMLALGRNQILVFDYGKRELLAFSMDGKLSWVRGRQGGGPGEFSGPTDMASDSKGAVYVLDPANSRITVYGDTGSFQRSIPLDQQLHRLVVRTDGSIAAAPLSDRLLVTLAANGTTTSSLTPPVELKTISPLLRENRLLATSRNAVLILHTWSTKILVANFDGGANLKRLGELRDAQPFPQLKTYQSGKYTVSRVDPGAKRVLRGASIFADTLFVADHRDAAGTEYIDAYSVSSLRYLFSRKSPSQLRAFAIRGDLLWGLVDEPVPALVAWRWKSVQRSK